MAARRLIQIVPVRAREPEGVGDYSRLIAERLAADGIQTSFIACTPLPPERRRHDDWPTVEIERRGKAELLAALAQLDAERDVPILLHLSGYGFQAKGVPVWLVRAIAAWRRTNPKTPLITIFHELFAKGPIWSSPFWIGWLQARVSREIQRMSDAGIATAARHVAILRSWHATPPTYWMPCFSTIGEPATPADRLATDRPSRLVIFGRPGILGTVYRDGLAPLAAFVRANGIEEILDIGARPVPPPSMIEGVRVVSHGECDPATLGDLLAGSRFGLVQYDADRLSKSSIFAAYCAHGVIPLCISKQAGEQDGLCPGLQYVRLDLERPSSERVDEINQLQTRAQAWYEPHSIGRTVALIRSLTEGSIVKGVG